MTERSKRITYPATVIDKEFDAIEQDWEGTTIPGVSYIVGRILGALTSWSREQAQRGDSYWLSYNHALVDAIYAHIRAIKMMESADQTNHPQSQRSD